MIKLVKAMKLLDSRLNTSEHFIDKTLGFHWDSIGFMWNPLHETRMDMSTITLLFGGFFEKVTKNVIKLA